MTRCTFRRGFTLLEMLLVLGVLGILAAIVLIAINPTKQLEDARGAKRTAMVREIENAIVQYIIDGNSLTGIPASKALAKDICRDSVTGTACTNAPVNGTDLSSLAPTYMVDLPVDPSETDEHITGYRIYQDGSFIRVCAPRLDASCGPA